MQGTPSPTNCYNQVMIFQSKEWPSIPEEQQHNYDKKKLLKAATTDPVVEKVEATSG